MTPPWWQPRARPAVRIGRADISISFEPRDMWVGVFWDRRLRLTQVFVCLVPCFPVRIAWREEAR